MDKPFPTRENFHKSTKVHNSSDSAVEFFAGFDFAHHVANSLSGLLSQFGVARSNEGVAVFFNRDIGHPLTASSINNLINYPPARSNHFTNSVLWDFDHNHPRRKWG